MQLPAPIQVRLHWRPGAHFPADLRPEVEREVASLAWELTQMEALLQDAIGAAGHERAYLMPRIEVRLPLYEARRRLRIVFAHVESTRIVVVDEEGKKLADVTLV